jgi:NADP-dependent 3-hydroxy acid dehydrogenase YdfG
MTMLSGFADLILSQRIPKTLAGRVAVITGASSGIGAATAMALGARGARVFLLARRKPQMEELVGKIQSVEGKATAIGVDVTNAAAVNAAASEILSSADRVDILVNNAGVMLPNPIEQLRTDQWEQQIDLNIKGLMNAIAAFTPALVKAAAAYGVADLVNISSIAGKNIFPNFAVYSATKAYVTHLSKHLRCELGAKGVRVCAIEPGIVGTELQSHVDFKGAQDWLESSKTQMEWLEPDDVAEAIAFVVSAPKRMNLQQVTILPTAQPM